ncbi:Dynein light chain 1, axonemal [Eumeta japonica]|uniref:Dynein axonemal light chain 1 n=1 Tax=Eumeta variegata TaxID=151549 RepID=A0A4C1XQA1_EUMVA|nr:Dynein light chain 1, axonemal [Eumeta japonica]
MIEKVSGLNSLKKLRVLSLGRNYIKSFAGMECLADTLEELWISYNLIEKLKGVNVLRNLRVLYMSNNLVKEWSEFNKLQSRSKRTDETSENIWLPSTMETRDPRVGALPTSWDNGGGSGQRKRGSGLPELSVAG